MKADGQGIRKRRETSGRGLRKFAAIAGLSASHVSRIERDLTEPQPEALARIAAALACSIEDLRPETNGDDDAHRRPVAVDDDEGSRGAHS
ncbi:helix-turn-helix domain-containing protein [Streptomyces sp. NBC_01508]|uniref:helix-turn-helix domain-containing protein n=1 Tax=Streptomyces sp. NBC_01508 TaxID=2903888 RepID=UPI003865D159